MRAGHEARQQQAGGCVDGDRLGRQVEAGGERHVVRLGQAIDEPVALLPQIANAIAARKRSKVQKNSTASSNFHKKLSYADLPDSAFFFNVAIFTRLRSTSATLHA